MTVSTVVNHEQYDGNGTTTVFPYRFRILKSSHMVVTVSDPDGVLTTLVLGTDYDITGVGLVSGGNVELKNPLAEGWKISLDRDLPAVQETDLRNQGKFFAETHEDAFDYLTMLIQKLGSLFSLALKKPSWIADYYDAQGYRISNLGEPVKDDDATTKQYVDQVATANLNHTLRVPEAFISVVPSVSQRANRVLGFNQEGNPIAVVPGSGDASQVMLDLASTASGKGDALIGVKQPFTGAVDRTQHSKNADVLSILDFTGDDPDVLSGVTDVTAAFTTAMQAGRTVTIPSGVTILVSPSSQILGNLIIDGTLLINNTCTIACDIQVRSGSVNVNSGFTATFNGTFTAPVRKIFNGSGVVYGIRHVYPEWWGAVADNVTDCATALNAASACIANAVGITGQSRPTIELMSGNYLIGSTWTILPSANAGVDVKGQGVIFSGTRIVAASTFNGSQAISMPIPSDSTQKILDFKLRDFGIVPQTVGAGPGMGIQLGSSGIMMNGLRESLIENIYLENFNTGIHCLNARLIKFNRVGVWNNSTTTASTNLMIRSDGKFCGDMSFENCQFVNQQPLTGSHAVRITSNGAFSSNGERAYQVAGIRFTECIFYPSDQTVYADCLGGSHIEDIFFTNCQFDGNSNTMIYCVSSGSGSILRDIQISHNYLFGGNMSTSAAQIQMLTVNSGIIQNIRIESNTLGGGIGRAVNLTTGSAGSIYGVQINNNYVVDFSNANNPAIEIGGGCLRIMVRGNMAATTANVFHPYFIQVDSGANYYVITDNMASGVASVSVVREVSAGSSRVVANNL